jgi:adenylate kinase
MLLERAGGYRHFDFGAELRAAAAGERGLPPDDVALVRRLLDAHALLPNERFDLAGRLLDAFGGCTGLDPARERLVLNGLPRHVGQARALARRGVRIEHVVVFECDAAVCRARVVRRRGGEGLDHAGREDDSPDAVARKLAIFREQTAPLIAHYQAEPDVAVHRVAVAAETRDEALSRRIRRMIEGRRAADEA